MRFIVTGTGRSGTGYTAELFRAAGLKCGHEDYFRAVAGVRDLRRTSDRPWPPRTANLPRRLREEARRRREDLDGDASWMAVPRLSRFSGTKFLQLRDPLKVVRSFMGTGFFTQARTHKAQTRFAWAHIPPTGDPLRDSMRWWAAWNTRAAEHAHLTYRLEDLDSALFAKMLGMLDVEESVAAAAFAAVATDVNSARSRTDTFNEYAWDDLPEGPEKESMLRAAERFGYPTG